MTSFTIPDKRELSSVIPRDLIHAINVLIYDRNMERDAVRRRLNTNEATIKRALFESQQAWDEYQSKLAKGRA